MTRFDHYNDITGIQPAFEIVKYLECELLLDLRSFGPVFHDSGNFAQPRLYFVRNVPDMHLANKGQQVMGAQARKLNPGNDNQLFGLARERCECKVDIGSRNMFLPISQHPSSGFFHTVVPSIVRKDESQSVGRRWRGRR